MTELKEGQIAVDEKQLNKILDTIEAQREEIRALYDGSIKILGLIGLAENGVIKHKAFEEDGNALPEILKGASSVISLVMQAQVPLIGKKAERELTEKFSFFAPLIPLFIKYGNEFGNNPAALPEGDKPLLLNE